MNLKKKKKFFSVTLVFITLSDAPHCFVWWDMHKYVFKYDILLSQFSKLSDPQIWLDAASQTFFSLCLGYGTVISFSSYNKTKNNCIYDAFTIVLINCGTSIFAGTVIYSILGHRQLDLGQDIHQVRALDFIIILRRFN